MVERNCLACGQAFKTYPYNIKIGKGKYCSQSCSASSRTGERNSKWVGESTKIACENCGVSILVRPYENRKFCSYDCFVEDRTGKELKRPEDKYYGNPKNRLARGISSYVSLSLKKGKQGYGWEKTLGYNASDLTTHLESQFKKGMSWTNYGRGGWHVDHIRPVRDFNFESPDDEEFKQCWSRWNLQPMWESENVHKGATCETPPLPLIN